mmetsp:Transcript_688/g.1611  ORF Transcript_688/g.1611 Transcript_688/m.1611 type:complete len:303 (-) Transcript_688:159-1067(-)
MTCVDNLYITDLPPNFDDGQLQAVFGAYGTIVQCKALPSKQVGGKVAALVRYGTPEEAQWIVDNLNGNIPQGLETPIKCRLADTPEARAGKGPGKGFGMDKGKGGYGKADSGKSGGMFPTPYSKGAYDGGKSAGKSAPMGCFGGKGGKDGGKSGKSGKDGKGKGKCSIRDIVKGMVKGQALPGTQEYSNDANALYIAGLPADTTDLELYKIFAAFGSIPPMGVRAMCGDDGMCKGFGFVNYIDPAAAQTAILTLHGTQLPNGASLTVRMKGPGKNAAGAEAIDDAGLGEMYDAQMQELLTQQ